LCLSLKAKSYMITSALTSETPAMTAPLISIRNLRLEFEAPGRSVYALRGIDLDVAPGEILAIVGESGSGKSVTGLSILGLHGKNARVSGEAKMAGQNLLALDAEALRSFRGRRIAMIFQEPMTALNPVFTVGYQIFEILSLHAGLKGEAAEERAIQLFQKWVFPNQRCASRVTPFSFRGACASAF
jgi:ABC-type microcin C transport system duplicated ATPase subunit YejF